MAATVTESVAGVFTNVKSTLSTPNRRSSTYRRSSPYRRELREHNGFDNFDHHKIRDKVVEIPHQLSNIVQKMQTSMAIGSSPVRPGWEATDTSHSLDDEEFINNVRIRDNADFVQLVFGDDGPLGMEIFRHSSNGVLVVKGVKSDGQADDICKETLLTPEIFKGAVILAINHVTYNVEECGVTLWEELIHPDRPKSILMALNRTASPQSALSVRRSMGINKIFGYNLVELVMSDERSSLGIRVHSQRTQDECKVELFMRKQEAYQRAMECLLDPAIFMDATIVAVNGRKYKTRDNMFNALQSANRPMHILFELAQSPARSTTSPLKAIASTIEPPTDIVPTPAVSVTKSPPQKDDDSVVRDQQEEKQSDTGVDTNLGMPPHTIASAPQPSTPLREWNGSTSSSAKPSVKAPPNLNEVHGEEQPHHEEQVDLSNNPNYERVMVTTSTSTSFIYKKVQTPASPKKPQNNGKGTGDPHGLSISNATAATEYTAITVEKNHAQDEEDCENMEHVRKIGSEVDTKSTDLDDSKFEDDHGLHHSEGKEKQSGDMDKNEEEDDDADLHSTSSSSLDNGVNSIGKTDRWETSSFDNDDEIRESFSSPIKVDASASSSFDGYNGNVELFFTPPQEKKNNKRQSSPKHHHHQILPPEEEEFRLSFFRDQTREEQHAQEEDVVFDETYMAVPSSFRQGPLQDEFGEYSYEEALVEEGCAPSDDAKRQWQIKTRRQRLQRQRQRRGPGACSKMVERFNASKYNTKTHKVLFVVIASVVAALIVLPIIAVKNRWGSGMKYT